MSIVTTEPTRPATANQRVQVATDAVVSAYILELAHDLAVGVRRPRRRSHIRVSDRRGRYRSRQ